MKVSRLACVVVALAGCGEGVNDGRRAPVPPPTVYVVNYPLRYFAERIGGERLRVVLPAPANVDPAFWSPDPETIVAFQRADLVLLNGAGYAKWVSRASLPSRKLVDTSSGFVDRLIPIEGAVTHTHGPEGQHQHGDLAFTTWLDVELAIEQARAVREAFRAAWPESEALFAERFASLERDLRALDERMAAVADRIGDRPLVFSHPVYQYFARRYELNGRAVHWEPDEVPTDGQWRELESLRRGHPARWMIWEGDPRVETVSRLEAAGIRSVVFAPCANAPDEGDYLATMMRNIERLEAAFR